MDVTSDHLDVIPPGTRGQNGQRIWSGDEQDNEAGEELSKRGEFFGKPVGKGEPPFCFFEY